MIKKVGNFVRKYRKIAVKAASDKEMYRLREVDALIEEELGATKEMSYEARLDYAQINDSIKEGNVDKVKELFNTKNRAWTKAMALKIQNEEDSND